jgi:hypothetical protein
MATATKRRYKPTESQYEGGATQMYVTYDLDQRTRGGRTATYPKVKRVYIAGDVKDWRVGEFEKRSGRRVHGVRIDYERDRKGFRRRTPGTDSPGSRVAPGRQHFTQVVELPERARNVRFRGTALGKDYKEALQDVR